MSVTPTPHALIRYGVVHRHEPGDPLYSHTPMSDGYWTPWHIAQERCDKLRAALVGLVGVDGREELEQMEAIMRLTPAPAADKAVTIDAIHALIATVEGQAQS